MVVQSQPTQQYNNQPAHSTNNPTYNNQPFSPRGGRQPRGNTRGRDYNNSPYLQRQNNSNNNYRYKQPSQKDHTINKYWPHPRQCMNCLETGHRMNICRNNSYCLYHRYQGHNLLDCRDFHNTTGLSSNTRGNFFVGTSQGEDTQHPFHPDLEY